MVNVAPAELRNALNQVDFPSQKDDLVVAAEQSNAPEHVQRALRSLPPVEYGNVEEVLRSVTDEVGSDRGRPLDPGDKPSRPGISERRT